MKNKAGSLFESLTRSSVCSQHSLVMERIDDPEDTVVKPSEFPLTVKMEVLDDSYHTDATDICENTASCWYVKEEPEDNDNVTSSVDYSILNREEEPNTTGLNSTSTDYIHEDNDHSSADEDDDDMDVGTNVGKNPDSVDEVWVCGICLQFFQNVEDFREHESSVHGGSETSLAAPNCDETKISEDGTLCGSMSSKIDRKRKLELSNTSTVHRKSTLQSHDLNPIQDRLRQTHAAVKCVKCGQTFNTLTVLVNHHRAHHSLGPPSVSSADNMLDLTCWVCSAVFQSEDELRDHFRTPHPSFQCGDCPEKFRTSAQLYSHYRALHAKRSWQCAKCPQTFFRMRGLLIHLVKRHDGKQHEWVCGECGDRYRSLRDYDSHLNLAHGQTAMGLLFKCDLCSNAYKTEAPLRLHCLCHHANERNAFGFLVSVTETEETNLNIPPTGKPVETASTFSVASSDSVPKPEEQISSSSRKAQSPPTSLSRLSWSVVENEPSDGRSINWTHHQLVDGSCPCVLDKFAVVPEKASRQVSKPYRCPYCFKCFSLYSLAHSHWSACRDRVQFLGDTVEPESLAIHFRPDSPCKVMCAYCAAWLLKPAYLAHTKPAGTGIRHAVRNSEKLLLCRLCSAPFVNDERLYKHETKCHSSLADLPLPIFVKKTNTKDDEIRKINANTKRTVKEHLRCNVCEHSKNTGLKKHHLLKIHQKKRHPEFTARCLVKTCYAVFKDDQELKEHRLLSHPWFCKTCNQKFATSTALQKHSSSHTDSEEGYKSDSSLFCGTVSEKDHDANDNSSDDG